MSFNKRAYIIVFFTALCCSAFAQDVVLEKEQRGDKFVVIAYNTSEKAQLVTLNLTLKYVEVNRELPVIEIVEPGEKKELAVLAPIPLEAWSYKTRYEFEEYIPPVKEATPQPYSLRIPNNESRPDVVEEPHDQETEKVDSISATTVSLQLLEEEAPIMEEEESSHPVNVSPYQVPESVSTSAGTTITSEVITINVKPASSMQPPQNTDDEPMPAKYASRQKGN